MSNDKTLEAIKSACKNAGDMNIMDIPLNSPKAELLNILIGNVDDHVVIQPAAIAYYGLVRKETEWSLRDEERDFEIWKKKKYQEAKELVMEKASTKKPTINDIESEFIRINEQELREREAVLAKLREQCDLMEVWYEAWKQKSYSNREHAQMKYDELYGKQDISRTDLDRYNRRGSGNDVDKQEQLEKACETVRDIQNKGE